MQTRADLPVRSRTGSRQIEGEPTPMPSQRLRIATKAKSALSGPRPWLSDTDRPSVAHSAFYPGRHALFVTPRIGCHFGHLRRIGATGFEPATARPPAGRPWAAIRPLASPASPPSPLTDFLDTLDASVGTNAVPRRGLFGTRRHVLDVLLNRRTWHLEPRRCEVQGFPAVPLDEAEPGRVCGQPSVCRGRAQLELGGQGRPIIGPARSRPI